MKKFAYYLPQFHCIPENDEWWGKGFTEWTNVKRAKPLFKGHIQPIEPLNDNYYSLDNIDTLKWQSNLLDSYNVDGLIFYHYYFTGKKLLEKPAEMLLNNKDINIKFFFCWANHSWFRSWEGSKKLLMEQKYGEKNDWENHFNYLLPFFKDERYEKRNNKPLFMIFRSAFNEKKAMFEFFNKKCIENGFDGICVIETVDPEYVNNLSTFIENKSEYTEFIHYRQPDFTMNLTSYKIQNFHEIFFNKVRTLLNRVGFKLVKRYNGNSIYKFMYKYNLKESNKNVIDGLFFEWDNTPRHSNRGYIVSPPDNKNFSKYMSLIKNKEYVFINAWNEWCEGAILEPTKHNKFKYLEWLKDNK